MTTLVAPAAESAEKASERLLVAVGDSSAGAVLADREHLDFRYTNGRDWHTLLEFCYQRREFAIEPPV